MEGRTHLLLARSQAFQTPNPGGHPTLMSSARGLRAQLTVLSSRPSGSTHSSCPQHRLLASQPYTEDSHGAHLAPTSRLHVVTMVFPQPSRTLPTWPIRVKVLGVPDCHLGKGEEIPAGWGKGHVLLPRVEKGMPTPRVKSGHSTVHSCSTNISEHCPCAQPVQGSRYMAVNKIRPGVPKGLRGQSGRWT